MKKIILLLSLLLLNSLGLLMAQDDANFLAGEKSCELGSYKLATEHYSKYIKSFEPKLAAYLEKVKSYDTSSGAEQVSLFPGFSVRHDWAVGYYKRGMAYLNISEFVLAGKDFDMAIQIDSKYPEALLQKGLSVIGKGKNEACPYICRARLLSDTMKAAKKAYKENFCWMCGIEAYTKGKTEVDLRQYAEGLKNLNLAIFFCKDSGNYYAYRGIAYEGLGKIDSALADYSSAIKMDSTKFTGYYRRALTLESAKKFKEALADLNKVLSLNPKYADAYKHHAADCESLDMPEAALYDYQNLIKLKPSEGISWYKMGMRKKNMGEDACDYFQKAADLGYEDAQPLADDCQKAAARKALK